MQLYCTRLQNYRCCYLIPCSAVAAALKPQAKHALWSNASYTPLYPGALWLKAVFHKLWMMRISVFSWQYMRVENLCEICFNFG